MRPGPWGLLASLVAMDFVPHGMSGVLAEASPVPMDVVPAGMAGLLADLSSDEADHADNDDDDANSHQVVEVPAILFRTIHTDTGWA